MARPKLPPRLWYDQTRQNWVIRDGERFIRVGAGGWRLAQDRLLEYLRSRGHNPLAVRKAGAGFIYFISAEFHDYPVKIGFTRRVNGARVQALQTACPFQLVMLGMFEGTCRDESLLHRQFAADRLCGEWFRRSDLLMEIVRQAQAEKAA